MRCWKLRDECSSLSHKPTHPCRVHPGRWSTKERGNWQGKGKLSSCQEFTLMLAAESRRSERDTGLFVFPFWHHPFPSLLQPNFILKRQKSECWNLPRKCISLQMKISKIAGSLISCADTPPRNRFRGWRRHILADRSSQNFAFVECTSTELSRAVGVRAGKFTNSVFFWCSLKRRLHHS